MKNRGPYLLLTDNVASLGVKFLESKDQRVGTNAFGASVVVSNVIRRTYAIYMKRSLLSVDFNVRMPPEQAQFAKDGIDILVTVGPSTDTTMPLVVEGSKSSTATFSSPLEGSESFYYLTLPLVSAWLANRASGQIFGKYDAVR